jgi:thiol-disulfide isomerase/thioredoxin
MLAHDLERFNQAVALAQAGQTAQAYAGLKALQPAYPTNADLLLWLTFTAPDPLESEMYLLRLRTVAPNNPHLAAAYNWLQAEKAKRAPVTPPPIPSASPYAYSPGYNPAFEPSRAPVQAQPRRKGSATALWSVGVLGILLLAAAAGTFLFNSFGTSGGSRQLGTYTAQNNFTLPDLQNRQVNLSDFQGKPVVAFFWASWCGYCNREMPDITSVASKYSDKAVILGINGDEDTADARSFAAAKKLSFPVLLDTGNIPVHRQFKVQSYPTHIFFKADGTVAKTVVGQMSRAELERELNRIVP